MIQFIKKLAHPHRPEWPRVDKEQMEGIILHEQLKDQIKRKDIRRELALRDGAA